MQRLRDRLVQERGEDKLLLVVVEETEAGSLVRVMREDKEVGRCYRNRRAFWEGEP